MLRTIRGRLAPTPSGYLHLGNIFNFLLTWLIVRKQQGTLFLRIDDLDQARVRQVYVQDIFETLDWLGIDYDHGPSSVTGAMGYIRQSERKNIYLAACELLAEKAEVYGCDQSRKNIMKLSIDGQYPIALREKSLPLQSEGVAWRIKIPPDYKVTWVDQWQGRLEVDLFQEIRDFIIKRKDGIPAYQIASLVDEDQLNINVLVRGADLISSTAAQYYLAKHLHWHTFTHMTYYHHSLITESGGEKLSKSAGGRSCRYLRSHGLSKQAVYSRFIEWLPSPYLLPVFSKKTPVENLQEILAAFNISP